MKEQTQEQHYDQLNAAIDAMSDLLKRWAVRGKGLKDEDKNGVVHYYSKSRVGVLMFEFVTKDDLIINMEFDLGRLRQEGIEYMETITEIIITQIDAAREERQNNNQIIVTPSLTNFDPAVKTTHKAVREALTAVKH